MRFVLADESSTANNTQLENNIDAVDDLAETDPSHYHISRTAYDRFDDSAVVMNGDDGGVVEEELIQPKRVIRGEGPRQFRRRCRTTPATRRRRRGHPTTGPVVLVTDIDRPG